MKFNNKKANFHLDRLEVVLNNIKQINKEFQDRVRKQEKENERQSDIPEATVPK